MARAGLTPNLLTLIGFGIAGIAAALAGFEWWLLAGIVGTFGAAFDMFDGAVARVTGTASPFGAFMDSTFDRWGEAVLYVGIVIGCSNAGYDPGAWLAAAAMGSAFMVSYVRARAESLGFSSGRGMAAIGLAPREVRTVILGVGMVGAGLLGGVVSEPTSTGATVLAAALALIAILATVTVLQRILFVQRQAGR
jgi:CDP-diacylglycerol--glycerol-3-phosphate 3-phosphatidyltransferase